jgi:hypothetical protein
MKRGLSGKTRRGSPPLPRQRKALRVVQLTLTALALGVALLAVAAFNQHRHPLPTSSVLGHAHRPGFGEVVALGVAAIGVGGVAVSMGGRVVRGPEPQTLD